MDDDDTNMTANNNSNAVGKISIGGNMSGNLVIGNNNKVTNTVNTGISAAEIKQLFDQLYTAIDTRTNTPPSVKEDLKAEVQDIQTTITEAVETNQKVEESFLSRRFRSIERMAPDILDVVVATIGNPLAGLGVAAKKIADKAREESKG